MSKIKYEPPWTGSYLGDYPIETIVGETRTKIGCYWKLQLDENRSFYCLVKKFRTSFNTILDEIKTSCRLIKLGTHTIKIGISLYLLIKVIPQTVTIECNGQTASIDVIHEDIPLSQYPIEYIDDENIQVIEKIFAFRYIMAINRTFESHIYMRRTNDSTGYYPVSFMESSVNFESKKEKLPSTVYSKWFLKQKKIVNVDMDTVDTLSNTVKSLLSLPIKGALDDQKVSAVATFRTRLENTINRIDKEQIWISSFVVQNIISKIY